MEQSVIIPPGSPKLTIAYKNEELFLWFLFVKMHVSSIISNTLMMDYIAHDIQANNTGTISLQEADFLQKTEKQMQKLGIKEHNGKYYQVNPAQGFSSSVPVKNMDQLNSQKAKDIKAYATADRY